MPIEKVADEIIQLSEYVLNHQFTKDIILGLAVGYGVIFLSIIIVAIYILVHHSRMLKRRR